MERSAGILLHISSLPNMFGIGDLGKAAYQFVDFLKDSGLKLWQTLAMGPTGYGDSPYSSLSAFGVGFFPRSIGNSIFSNTFKTGIRLKF